MTKSGCRFDPTSQDSELWEQHDQCVIMCLSFSTSFPKTKPFSKLNPEIFKTKVLEHRTVQVMFPGQGWSPEACKMEENPLEIEVKPMKQVVLLKGRKYLSRGSGDEKSVYHWDFILTILTP